MVELLSGRRNHEKINDDCEYRGENKEDENKVPLRKALDRPKDKSATLTLDLVATAGIVKKIRDKAAEHEHKTSSAITANLNGVKSRSRTTSRTNRRIVTLQWSIALPR